MNQYFKGYYYKHHIGDRMLAFIPGYSDQGAFIQVITEKQSYYISYPLSAYHQHGNHVSIGKNSFSLKGCRISIDRNELLLKGKFRYKNTTSIAYDIMGPFAIFPMECKHTVLSLGHDIEGVVSLNGESISFTGGKGYIEGDRGKSFPKSYTWVQCNDFGNNSSIMASSAKIPFLGFNFTGCIAVAYIKGKEYRLATYKGVKIIENSKKRLELLQGKYRLVIEPKEQNGYPLYAPKQGRMSRIIHENPLCEVSFKFFINNSMVFSKTSKNASFEFVP